MAEQTEESQKTEEPTQKRLDDSRKKGQVANSREVNHWLMILAVTLVIMMFAPNMTRGIGLTALPFIEAPHLIHLDEGAGVKLFSSVALKLAFALSVPFGFLMVAAIIAGIIQNGPIFSSDLIKPKLEKISPTKGLKRLFSLKSIAEFVKGILKLSVVATVAAILMVPAFDQVESITNLDASGLLVLLRDLAVRMLIGVVAVMTVIAGLDLLYQRYEHNKSMKMSRQEIKDEHKESEGDPAIKGRLRQLRQERARQRMMAAVPYAEVVIANPTHFAVALSYKHEVMDAPKVVAKGADLIALRIKEVAEENNVPVVENPPLARALFNGVDLEQEVPPEHYKAVAEVIGYVMKLKRRVMHA